MLLGSRTKSVTQCPRRCWVWLVPGSGLILSSASVSLFQTHGSVISQTGHVLTSSGVHLHALEQSLDRLLYPAHFLANKKWFLFSKVLFINLQQCVDFYGISSILLWILLNTPRLSASRPYSSPHPSGEAASADSTEMTGCRLGPGGSPVPWQRWLWKGLGPTLEQCLLWVFWENFFLDLLIQL